MNESMLVNYGMVLAELIQQTRECVVAYHDMGSEREEKAKKVLDKLLDMVISEN